MKPQPDSLDAAVRGFRDIMATPTDGRATRARVLDLVACQARRRQLRRRLGLLLAAAFVATSTASVAWTALVRWRASTPKITAVPRAASVPQPPKHGAPAQVSPPAPEANPADEESHAYGRAHRAHFGDGPPARALVAWNEYLRRFPTGAFAPEARYNRALCLLRLGRHPEAAAALRPIARGLPGGYRRKEACALLEWLASQQGSGGEPACSY